MLRLAVAVVGLIATAALPALAAETPSGRFPSDPAIERRIDALIAQMTLQEKAGQLYQGGWGGDFNVDQARTGAIGTMTNLEDPAKVGLMQGLARQSRLHIPLLFTSNVIHGFRTMMPAPIGLAATFNPALVEQASEAAGREAAAAGLHWTLGPMVDIARDPRWGRVVEGAGEDPYLGSLMAAAQVRGLLKGGIMASLKHYVGYGAVEGGRDYNSTEIPRDLLRDVYLPPFKAGIDAGAQSVMAAFNALNGVPATANHWALTEVLKGEWGFDGFVLSDWDSIMELTKHGIAADGAEAVAKALNAGADIEMAGNMFPDFLIGEIKSGRVPMARIDDAVRRLLRVKFRMGVFDRPDVDYAKAEAAMFTPATRAVARAAAAESVVLLKNDGKLLPLAKTTKTIAVIGAMAADRSDHMGPWGANGHQDDVTTSLVAIKAKLGGAVDVRYAPGCGDECLTTEGFAEAVAIARQADVVVAFLGEPWFMTAEAASRTEIGLANHQQELLEALVATGKPVVLVVFGGRPMTIKWAAEHVAAILYAWFPGSEGGPAVADILFGDVSPSGKLPMTMPRAVGQIPIYYNHLPTGRPTTGDKFSTRYIDEEVTPLYPFGWGLSYGEFRYSDLTVSKPKAGPEETVQVSVRLKNAGTVPAREAVQLYVRDVVASRSRPVRELKGLAKIELAPGEERVVRLPLDIRELGFHHDDGRYTVEAGRFQLWVGGSSAAELSTSLEVTADWQRPAAQ